MTQLQPPQTSQEGYIKKKKQSIYIDIYICNYIYIHIYILYIYIYARLFHLHQNMETLNQWGTPIFSLFSAFDARSWKPISSIRSASSRTRQFTSSVEDPKTQGSIRRGPMAVFQQMGHGKVTRFLVSNWGFVTLYIEII